ncbi:MAG: family B DNA polymerase [Romboutsia timonensis]|uniref:family B DNA polymerase n=1 Tax=Romboutsia timonensis TaxID=1776391 RepID=UPI0039A06D35
MVRYTENSHSAAPNRKCKMILKNEFLFRRVLLTYNKKNYASIQEIQEGNQIPPEEALDVKGLPMNKSTLNKETRRRLKEILYEDILNTPAIDQIKVLKSLAKLEKDIYTSLSSGSKDYYIPSRIKSMYSYKDPETVQGIKAAMAYNELKDSDMEALDLTQINSIDIVKVLINSKTIEPLKETNPELYEKISNLLKSSTFKGEITSLAIPINEKTPEWVIDFIDFNTIVSNNIVFPIESLGIYEGKCNYTNVIKL